MLQDRRWSPRSLRWRKTHMRNVWRQTIPAFEASLPSLTLTHRIPGNLWTSDQVLLLLCVSFGIKAIRNLFDTYCVLLAAGTARGWSLKGETSSVEAMIDFVRENEVNIEARQHLVANFNAARQRPPLQVTTWLRFDFHIRPRLVVWMRLMRRCLYLWNKCDRHFMCFDPCSEYIRRA